MYDAVYHVRKRAQRVEITGKDRKYELAADEIVVFEVYDHELKITLKDGEKILSGSLHTYEEKLEEYGFIKISRSVMLNPRYIKNISSDEAVMINGSIYKISRNRLKNVEGNMNYVRGGRSVCKYFSGICNNILSYKMSWRERGKNRKCAYITEL
ncbi:MAG: LytTR family DNA-binding domain-containing protein [Lachnospira eligens]